MDDSKTVEMRRLTESGIQLCMKMQQAIVEQAISIIERKLIIRVKHFRYACLRLSENEEKMFTQSQTLSKLALFLVDIHRVNAKSFLRCTHA